MGRRPWNGRLFNSSSTSDSWIWPDCDGKQGGGKAHGVVLVSTVPSCADGVL